MAMLTVHPTRLDRTIAREVSDHTDPTVERVAEIVTWGADEHVLLGLAALGWLFSRGASRDARRLADHFLVCSVATAALPHIMKRVINQERPDRLTIEGHLRGAPFSGKSDDAFPSGHALHVGALASAATLLPSGWKNAVWAASTVLVTTRVILLAHWLSDVVAGLACGFGVERALRLITKPPHKSAPGIKRVATAAGRQHA